MTGLRIQIPYNLISYKQSSFEVCFEPILWQLGSYWWWIGLPPSSNDPALEKAYHSFQIDQCTPPFTLIPQFARYVIADWNKLYGFHENPGSIEKVENLLVGIIDRKMVMEIADILIESIDDAYWVIFSHDKTLNPVIKRYIDSIGGSVDDIPINWDPYKSPTPIKFALSNGQTSSA